MITQEKYSEIKEIFRQNSVILAYVFGSQANNTSNKESDLDIAILLPPELTKMKRFNIRIKVAEKLSRIFKMPIDLVVFNDLKSLFFKFIIIKEGKLIYSKTQSDQLDFECKLMGEYFDFKPFLELQNKHYVQRSL